MVRGAMGFPRQFSKLGISPIRTLSSKGSRLPYNSSDYPRHVLGVRPIVIQRRYLLGPIFRFARTGIAVTAGAAAGGAAYANHKFSEATHSISDKFDRASDWIGDVFNKIDFGGSTGGVAEGVDNVNFTGREKSSNSHQGNNGGGQQNNGSPPGGQQDTAALSAMSAAIASDEDADASFQDQLSHMDNQMINLTKKMIEIRNILLQIDGSDKIQLPSIVVIGSQSSGKSSVLEAIVGHEFLPKGSNMVTRRPIELTLVHTPSNSGQEYCEFPTLRLGKISNFSEVQKTLTDLNLSVPSSEVVSDEPIQLRVHSPHVPDLTLIDLPGYIQVVAADQPLELKSRIAALCEKYIQPPNVILAVSAADVDLANSTALRASRKVDPQGLRTIGVITKMDLVDPERGVSSLLTREYPLRMGYVGVVTRPQRTRASSLFSSNPNQTKAIAEAEQAFFVAPEYRSVNWGVLKLRSILTEVLEKSMSASLIPTQAKIKKELEETAYAFKVRYNDRVLTPQTYLAQCADAFKVSFQDMSNRFGRDQVRALIKQKLDQKVLDLLAEYYWNKPPGMSPDGLGELYGGSESVTQPPLSDLAAPKPDMLAWQYKIDQLSNSLTKFGIGRLSTSILVDAISERMNQLVTNSPFANSPLAVQQVNEAVEKILSTKFYITADQIENSIKPYKYEVDMDAREWQQSREYACTLLKEELRQCKLAYNVLENEIGGSKLHKLVKSLDALAPTENLDHFSASLLSKARLAMFLKERMDLLQARSVFIKSSKCKSRKNKALCPEVFMDVVSNKLAATSVLFLNFELLSDFYYSFPREFDAKLQALGEDQVEILASQDPKVKQHIDLQHRKELLQLALSKLQTVNELRSLEKSSL